MKTKLVKVGNSKGIRIPNSILKQCSIDENIELEVINKSIIIKSLKTPRFGWDEQMKKMNELGEDNLFISDDIDIEMDDWEW